LPQLEQHLDMAAGATSIGDYFTNMLDPSMNWRDVAEMVRRWNDQFCLKGIMSVPMRRGLSRSAALASLFRTTGVASSMAHAARSIS
jgi:isopentenyl diphosphate isomerase/L-lactate dehydrogenase-like FMN-dependent dehydrogenase